MDKAFRIKLRTFLIVCLLIFFTKGFMSTDPDFGWRLRTGQIILKSGVPKVDIYSYTMPSFAWVDHAWVNDVIISLTYSTVGYFGLALLFSIITTMALRFSILSIDSLLKGYNFHKRINVQYIAAPILILAAASFLRFSGVRAQVWTWLMLSIFNYLILNKELWKRYKFLIPLLILVWVNLHGGFVVGIFIVLFKVVSETIRQKKINMVNIAVLVFSVFVTFVNPYGIGVYKEIWSSISDKDLSTNVMEWNSYFGSFNLPSLFLVVISVIFVLLFKTKLGLMNLFLYFCFLYQAMTSVRQVPLFALVALPITTFGVCLFYESILKDRESKKRFVTVYNYFSIIAVLIFIIEAALTYKASVELSEKKFYPGSAVRYLSQNKSNGNIFAEYGWGGYLIWKMPEKKIFIDGRMPSWKTNNTGVGESSNAMEEYMQIVRGEVDYNPIFEKYGIDTVLWPKTKPLGILGKVEKKYFDELDFIYKMLGKKHSKFNFEEMLQNNGWKVIFADDTAKIYRKG